MELALEFDFPLMDDPSNLFDDDDDDGKSTHGDDASASRDGRKTNTRITATDPGDQPPENDEASDIDLIAGVDYDVSFLDMMETIGWVGITAMAVCLFTTLLLMGKVEFLPWPDRLFGVYIAIFLGTFAVVTISAGCLRVYMGVNISYTRKVTHFFSFFLPFGLSALIPFEKTLTTYIFTFCAAFIAFVPLVEKIRNISCMWPLRLAYASFDRREDRPLTLLWAVTQALMVYAVMLPCILALEAMDDASYVLIPLIVTGIGDGLAEPIGKTVGYHKYRVTAMCTRKQYTRSIQGSLMLVVSGVAVVSVMYGLGLMSLTQFLVAFFVVPVPMAIAEAKSPHSWDNPFLLLVGGLLAIGVSAIQYM